MSAIRNQARASKNAVYNGVSLEIRVLDGVLEASSTVVMV